MHSFYSFSPVATGAGPLGRGAHAALATRRARASGVLALQELLYAFTLVEVVIRLHRQSVFSRHTGALGSASVR